MKKNHKIQLIQDSALQGVAEAQTKAMGIAFKVSGWSEKTKRGVLAAMILGAVSFNSAVAFAASKECGGEAANKLVGFIEDIAQFVMYIAGALAILMFVVGAVYIITGSKQSNVTKGIGFLKNAALGLGVLILVFFMKTIIVNLSVGLGGENSDTSCVNDSNKFS